MVNKKVGENYSLTSRFYKVAGLDERLYQVLVHLAKQFQRRFLKIDQPETRIAYGNHVS
jgi:hypothetical protein